MEKVSVYRIKYEIEGNRERQWLTTIAAHSMDDAQAFLSRVAGGKSIHFHEFGTVTKLDALTDTVAKAVASEVNPPKKPEKPKHICTYCGRDDFKDQTGLKGHMTRWCEVAKEEREKAEKEEK
jgi:hypothetical protein